MKLSDHPSYPESEEFVKFHQCHPFEVDVNEVPIPEMETKGPTPELGVDEKKKWGQALEMGVYEGGGRGSPNRSPDLSPVSPETPSTSTRAYTPASIAVELDGTSSVRGR